MPVHLSTKRRKGESSNLLKESQIQPSPNERTRIYHKHFSHVISGYFGNRSQRFSRRTDKAVKYGGERLSTEEITKKRDNMVTILKRVRRIDPGGMADIGVLMSRTPSDFRALLLFFSICSVSCAMVTQFLYDYVKTRTRKSIAMLRGGGRGKNRNCWTLRFVTIPYRL